MKDCCIIGAGASGLFCASFLPAHREKCILEKSERAGKKLLLAGKGRCNFSNTQTAPKHYIGEAQNKEQRLQQIFASFGPKDIQHFLDQHQLEYQEEDRWRLLLKNARSQHFLELLLKINEEKGSQIQYQTEIYEIEKKSDHFLIKHNQGETKSKRVVIACWGMSFPKIGATDFIFSFAKKHQLDYKTPAPALCWIETKEDLSSLTGSAIIVKNQLIKNGKILYEEESSVLFTHRGISSPSIFNMSLYLSYYAEENLKDYQIKLIIPEKEITKRLISYLKIKKAKNSTLILTPKSLRGRDDAKVMSGGLSLDELNEHFELKKIPGIFVLGEAINITWRTGGYNLQRCRSSAHACAKHLAKQV